MSFNFQDGWCKMLLVYHNPIDASFKVFIKGVMCPDEVEISCLQSICMKATPRRFGLGVGQLSTLPIAATLKENITKLQQ